MSYTINSENGALTATITPATMRATTTVGRDNRTIEFHIERMSRSVDFVDGVRVRRTLTSLLRAGCTLQSTCVSGLDMHMGARRRIVSLCIISSTGKRITFWGHSV